MNEQDPWYGGDFWKRFAPTLIIILVVLFVVVMLIGAIGNEAGDLHRHISSLIRRGGTMFRNPDGFSAAVELIAIAVFVGWALNRFMKK